ncbi:MAG TPA: hypothetical protein GXX55_05320 [Firmicutes bacterium]|nr:hypothetical protein [Bacillota bacterium]
MVKSLANHTMNKLERFRAAIAGEEVDHPPASVWLHFASEHLSGEETARLHLRYFTEYDWDFLKVMNDYRYPLPAGLETVATEADLRRFEPLSLAEEPFARQLTCIRYLRQELGPDVPIVETIFSPLQTVVRAAGAAVWPVILAHPQAGLAMLAAVTRTLVAYVAACREAGATGIFYSINGASRVPAPGTDSAGSGTASAGARKAGRSEAPSPSRTTAEQFERFIAPFDREILRAAGQAGLVRIGHVHGVDLDFDRVAGYPVEAFNWSHHHTAPTLAEVRERTGKAVIGGIDELVISYQSLPEVEASIRAAHTEWEGGRGNSTGGFLVGPGCTVPPDTPRRTLHRIREVTLSGASGPSGASEPFGTAKTLAKGGSVV